MAKTSIAHLQNFDGLAQLTDLVLEVFDAGSTVRFFSLSARRPPLRPLELNG